MLEWPKSLIATNSGAKCCGRSQLQTSPRRSCGDFFPLRNLLIESWSRRVGMERKELEKKERFMGVGLAEVSINHTITMHLVGIGSASSPGSKTREITQLSREKSKTLMQSNWKSWTQPPTRGLHFKRFNYWQSGLMHNDFSAICVQKADSKELFLAR